MWVITRPVYSRNCCRSCSLRCRSCCSSSSSVEMNSCRRSFRSCCRSKTAMRRKKRSYVSRLPAQRRHSTDRESLPPVSNESQRQHARSVDVVSSSPLDTIDTADRLRPSWHECPHPHVLLCRVRVHVVSSTSEKSSDVRCIYDVCIRYSFDVDE